MKPPAFQFYVDDFLGGTMHFSDAELGLYMRLLCVQWSTGGLPDSDDELLSYGKAGPNPTLHRVKAKFKRGDDGLLRNDRMEQERAKQIEYRLRQSENGRRGGRPGKPTENPTLSQPKAESKPNESSPVSVSGFQSPLNTNTPLPPKGGELPLLAPPVDKPEASAPSDSHSQGVTPENQHKASPPTKAKGPLQLRAERIFNRRESTPLTRGESRAMANNRPAIESTTEDDWQALERFYAAPQSQTYARKDLSALLNNWNGEIDRAKAWMGQAPAGYPVEPIKPRIPDNLRDDFNP